MTTLSVKTADFVNVKITTSNTNQMVIEKRFQKSLTILDLKNKLELITGGCAATMKLEIYDQFDNNVMEIAATDDDKMIGAFPIDDGSRLNVVDTFQLHQQINAVTVPKFELTTNQYSKKSNTLKAFLMRNKLGKYSEKCDSGDCGDTGDDNNDAKQKIESIQLNARCLVTKPDRGTLKGTVRYVGQLKGRKDNCWIGVEYDEPFGTCNGTFNNISYFDCCEKYGDFVLPENVKCGDFPKENDGLSDDENDIDEI